MIDFLSFQQFFTSSLTLFLFLFLESSILPFPVEFASIFVGFIHKNPIEAIIISILASSLGGLVGYYIGLFSRRKIFSKIFSGKIENEIRKIEKFLKKFEKFGIFVGRAIPIVPFKLFSIACGFLRIDVKKFFILTVFGLIPRSIFLIYSGHFISKNLILGTFISLLFAILYFYFRKKF